MLLLKRSLFESWNPEESPKTSLKTLNMPNQKCALLKPDVSIIICFKELRKGEWGYLMMRSLPLQILLLSKHDILFCLSQTAPRTAQ